MCKWQVFVVLFSIFREKEKTDAWQNHGDDTNGRFRYCVVFEMT